MIAVVTIEVVNTRYAEKCLKTLEINNAPTAIPRYTIPPRKPFVLFCKYEEKRKKNNLKEVSLLL